MIYYQSDLNFDQFDLNFGQIIYSYSGQFASTATTASSSSPHNFLCRFQLRGDSWGVAQRLVACIFILPGGMAQVSVFLRPFLVFGSIGALRHSCSLLYFCVIVKKTSDGSLCFYIDLERFSLQVHRIDEERFSLKLDRQIKLQIAGPPTRVYILALLRPIAL